LLISDEARNVLAEWFRELMKRSGLLMRGKFIPKGEFKTKGFLGSGGIGRFRDTLWAAAISAKDIGRLSPETKTELAEQHKARVYTELAAAA
jgi:hypothetical protein